MLIYIDHPNNFQFLNSLAKNFHPHLHLKYQNLFNENMSRFRSIRGVFPLQSPGQYRVLPHSPIPEDIPKPFYYKTKGKGEYTSTFKGNVEILSASSIEKMRTACKIASGALQLALDSAKPGITTEQIDKLVHNYIISQKAYPSGVYFMGFPKSLCTSVNEIVCHGVPNLRPLQDGDIVNFDVTAFIDEHYGDNSDMAIIGKATNKEVHKLIEVTRESVWKAIKICRPGVEMKVIGEVIENYVRSFGFAVCHEFLGHGIGANMHMPPPVMNNVNDTRVEMKPGMTFTIEPIVMENPDYKLGVWDDGWTIADMTGGLSAQYEHTILITEDGCEVLTDRKALN